MHLIVYISKKCISRHALSYICLLILVTLSSHSLPIKKDPPGRKPLRPAPINLFTHNKLAYPVGRQLLSPTDNDPIRFSIHLNKPSIRLGETIDLTIKAELLTISPNLLFHLPGSNTYKLKLLLPDGFEQTGGDFIDYIGTELTYPSRTEATYHIIGHFSSVSSGTAFRLLRSHGQADAQSLFVEKATLNLQELTTEKIALRKQADADNKKDALEPPTLYVVTDNSSKSARIAGPDYRGILEFANCDIVGGWAIDLTSPRQSVGLDIYINGVKVATIKADQNRSDVAKTYGVSGFDLYGYRWNIPDQYKSNKVLKISVKYANTANDVSSSPLNTPVCPGSGTTPDSDTQTPVTNANYRGFLEFATCDIIGGWAMNGNSPRESVSLDIYINDVKVTTIKADQNRTDVANAYNVSGFDLYGYRWNIPAMYKNNTPLKIAVKATGSAFELVQSPMTTASCPGSGTPPTTTPTPSCAFDVSVNSLSATCGSTVSLNAACVGANCDGVSYAWSGNGASQQGQVLNLTTPATNGTYSYTVTATKNGCSSKTAVGVVTVTGCTPPPTTPTCTFDLSVNSLSATCGSTVSLNAACVGANCDGVSYAWSGNGASQQGQVLNLTAPATNGTYSYTVTATKNGCSSKTAVGVVTVTGCTPPPTTPNCTFDLSVNSLSATCGSTVSLNANCVGANCDGVSYAWSGNGASQQGQVLNLTAPATNGTYSYTVTATKNGCSSKTAVGVVTVTGCTPPPTTSAEYRGFLDNGNCNFVSGWVLDTKATQKSQSVDIFINGTKATTILANQTRTDVANAYGITGFAQFGYSWSIPDSYKNNTPLTISVKAAGATFELTQSPMTTASCPGSGTTTPAPNCTFDLTANSVNTTCGSTVSLNANCTGANCDGITYTWSGNGISQQGQVLNLTAPATNGTYSYTVTATRNGCSSKTAVGTVTVTGCTPPPTTPTCTFDLSVNSLSATCGSTVSLNANCTGANCDGVSYAWSGNGASQQGQVLNLTAPATNGTYSYTVTATKNGCSSKTAVGTVMVTGCMPTANCAFNVSANSANASCGGTVNLNANCTGANCDGITYTWSGNGISQQGQTVNFTAPSSNGSYTYTVTASRNGCDTKTATATVTVDGCSTTPSTDDYPILSSPQPADKRPILQNERVRVAIDLGVGGVVREVTDLQVGENMINCYVKSNGKRDPGRDDQISLYSLPDANQGWTKNGKPVLDDIGYNPVQGGSVAGDYSPILGYGRTDKMLYCKTRGLHWGLSNEPGDYVVEQWIRLEGNIVRRHVRITGDRPDQTKYSDSRNQEIPCTYTSSQYYQYYVVQGDPYTNAPLVNVNAIPNIGGSGKSLNQYDYKGHMGPYSVDASEPWIAAVRASTNRGLALHTPYSHHLTVALFDSPGIGPPESINAGYIANSMNLILDPNGVYEFDINMVVGTMDEIRSTISRLPRSETKPNYIFANSPIRHGFTYRKGYDQGYPITNELVITPTDRRFRLVSPHKGYKSSEFGVIYVRMRAITPETQLSLDWRKMGQSELEVEQAGQAVRFNIIPDNRYHTYAIPVKNSAQWNGIISEFSIRYLNPTESSIQGQQFGVKWISATDLGDQ